MDFTQTEDHHSVEALARQILTDLVTDDYQKAWEDNQPSFDKGLWKTLAEAGLVGLASKEANGGSAMSFMEAASVLEAQGSVLAGLPLYQTIVAAQVLEAYAAAELCETILPKIFAGDGHLSLGLDAVNREGLSSEYFGEVLVAKDGVLNGLVNNVAYANDATAVLIALQLDGQNALYLLQPDVDVIEMAQQDTTYRHAHYQLGLNNVEIDQQRLIRDPGAVEYALQRALCSLAAMQLGVCENVLQRTADYTTERNQFGKPIASFQAVSHRAADGFVDCSALRACVLQTAWRLSSGLDATTEARSAKWWAAEAGHRVSHTAQHLHGGIGSDVEYPIHRYFRWAKQIEFSLGGAQELLAQQGRLLAERSDLGIEV